jgi:hypothetical protein
VVSAVVVIFCSSGVIAGITMTHETTDVVKVG